jgi:hypothetical protein
MYVYCLNSSGGLEHDRINQRLNRNPAVTGEVTAKEMIGLIISAPSSRAVVFPVVPALPRALAADYGQLDAVFAPAHLRQGATGVRHDGAPDRRRAAFVLGYAAVRPIDEKGLLIGAYFALVFAAGHLNTK